MLSRRHIIVPSPQALAAYSSTQNGILGLYVLIAEDLAILRQS